MAQQSMEQNSQNKNDQGQPIDSNGLLLPSPELVQLRTNKLDAWNYRFRKVLDWDENYELYRGKVITNRLMQRQGVHLPIMKTQIKTLLKDVDDMPVIEYQNLDNQKDSEIMMNSYWNWTSDQNKFELQDIMDKKQVFLFGRSYMQWQIQNGMITGTVQDPYDILIQRYADPFDIHSSRFLIHMHIFVPLSTLDQNKDYDKTAVEEMQKWYKSRLGVVKASENARFLVQKQQRQADLGVPDIRAPQTGETFVELALHFVYKEKGEPWTDFNTGKKYVSDAQQIFLYVECDNMRILMKKPLEVVIGKTSDNFWRTHYPYDSWADDIERQDWYSNAVADDIRVCNQIMDAWFSQMVENRSLKNLNMHIYNSSIEGFTPQTWTPIAWGMYGIPLPANSDVKLADVFAPVDVGDLSDELNELEFIQNIIEAATGANPTQQGQPTQGDVTLGEVKLQLQNAQQRVKGMSKFYTQVWKERATLFLKLCEAAPDQLDPVTITKKGKNGKQMWSREVAPKDWHTKNMYSLKIWDQDQKNATDIDALNKLNAVKSNMPDNPKLEEIYDRKLLEFAGLSPEEVKEVMELEMEKLEGMAQGQTKKVPTESITLPYQFAPDPVKREIEAAFGLTPQGGSQQPGMQGQPTNPQQVGNAPTTQPMTPQIPSQAQTVQQPVPTQ